MTTRWRWAIVSGGLGLYVAGLGFLVTQWERVRFDHPQATALNTSAAVARQGQADPAQPKQTAAKGHEANNTPWVIHLRRLDAALATNNISAAEMAWHEAFGATLVSRRWEGFVKVGDAYLRIGEAAKGRKATEAMARRMYLAALFRARNEGSLDGVLRVAEAFAALGDHEVVEQCLRVAEGLVARGGDPQVRDRVHAFRERMTNQYLVLTFPP